MLIMKVSEKYNYWKDGRQTVLCTRNKNREVCRGTLEECETFEALHPYGITRKEWERGNR